MVDVACRTPTSLNEFVNLQMQQALSFVANTKVESLVKLIFFLLAETLVVQGKISKFRRKQSTVLQVPESRPNFPIVANSKLFSSSIAICSSDVKTWHCILSADNFKSYPANDRSPNKPLIFLFSNTPIGSIGTLLPESGTDAVLAVVHSFFGFSRKQTRF
jgi:hypothetical protein